MSTFVHRVSQGNIVLDGTLRVSRRKRSFGKVMFQVVSEYVVKLNLKNAPEIILYWSRISGCKTINIRVIAKFWISK